MADTEKNQPVDALPPLPTEKLLKIIAANTGLRINLSLGDLDLYLAVARAAVEADRAPRPGYLKASETDCRIFEKAAQALLDRALAHYRASNFTLQDECLQCVEVIRDALEALTRQMSFTHADDIAWGHFADATKAKMAEGREKGRGGWEDPEQCPTERLQLMLLEHLKKGDPVDVANFCMMLWTRGEPVVAVDLKAARQAVLEDAAAICDNFAKRDMHPAECASAIRMMKDSIK